MVGILEDNLLVRLLLRRRTEILRALRDRRGFRRSHPELDLEILQRLLRELTLHPLLGLDFGDPLLREIRSHADLAAILIDLLLADAFDLAEVGRQVYVDRFRQLRD